MPDGDPPADPAATPDTADPAGAQATPAAEAVTASGYAYEVVEDNGAPTTPATAPASPSGRRVPVWALFATMLLAALVAGLVVWLFLRGSDAASSQATTTTGSGLLNAFTAGGETTTTTRYEGELPPGFPDDMPMYDEEIVASVLQLSEQGTGYIVVQHSDDDRDTIGEQLGAELSEGSWQIDGGQESADATLFQFSKTDDANVSGIVLLTQSKDGERTTIITSLQDASGAESVEDEPFVPGDSRNVPAGFPDELVPYPDATLIESAYQKEAGRTSYALSYVTDAEADAVVTHYTDTLEAAGLTVEEGDPATSTLEDAQVLSFSNEDLTLQGEVAIGTFAEDENYTRIDVQVGDERDAESTPEDEPTSEGGGD